MSTLRLDKGADIKKLCDNLYLMLLSEIPGNDKDWRLATVVLASDWPLW